MKPRWFRTTSGLLTGAGVIHLSVSCYKNQTLCEDSIKNELKKLTEKNSSLDPKSKAFIKQSLRMYDDYSNGKDIHAKDLRNLQTLGNQIIHDHLNSTPARQIGYGFVMGYFTGFCVRRAFRIGTLLIGGYFVLSQTLAYSGYKSTLTDIEKTIHDIENLRQPEIIKKITNIYHANLPVYVRYHMPSTGSFIIGFLLGFRK